MPAVMENIESHVDQLKVCDWDHSNLPHLFCLLLLLLLLLLRHQAGDKDRGVPTQQLWRV